MTGSLIVLRALLTIVRHEEIVAPDGGITKRDDDVNILCYEIAGQQRRALVVALHPSK
jgi:hypothetical protein